MLWIGKLCLLYLFVRQTDGLVEPIMTLPKDLQDIFDTQYHSGDLNKHSGQLVFWQCLENYMAKFMKHEELGIEPEMQTYLIGNMTEFMEPLINPTSYRKKRQAIQPRIRYEIRSMPLEARSRYFQAVNLMKRDIIIRVTPSQGALSLYDILARMHSGALLRSSHGGPAFLAWHRVFLWLYESYLRTYIPDVTVPYWGSVLDSEMRDPAQSVLFTSEFYGSGIGTVDGPFVEWPAINPDTVFFRNMDETVDLMSYEAYESVISKERNWQILKPTAEWDSDLENEHGLSHVFIGGSMNSLNTAVRDPIFFSHHCFIDKIWEDFRLRQRRNGIRVDRDYPWNENDDQFRRGHGPNSRTGFVFDIEQYPNGTIRTSRGFDVQNFVGFSTNWFQLVQYDPLPTCNGTNTCNSNSFLMCNANNRCTSRSAQELQRGKRRRKRAMLTEDGSCKRKPIISDISNSFMEHVTTSTWSSKTIANENKWVYIPVNIITKRNPSYKGHTSYSLSNKHTFSNGPKSELTYVGNPHSFKSCIKNQNAVGRMKIVSYGLNYFGYNEEFATGDNRLGLSVLSGFIPVKNPNRGATEALIAVVDSCGRVCRPYSKYGSDMVKTTGAIRITNIIPKQYAESYGEATMNSWYVNSPGACPNQDDRYLPVTFFCEYTDNWYWNAPVTMRPAPPTGYLGDSLFTNTSVIPTGYQSSIVPESTYTLGGLTEGSLKDSPVTRISNPNPDYTFPDPSIFAFDSSFNKAGLKKETAGHKTGQSLEHFVSGKPVKTNRGGGRGHGKQNNGRGKRTKTNRHKKRGHRQQDKPHGKRQRTDRGRSHRRGRDVSHIGIGKSMTLHSREAFRK